ncbi:restriction endonuclease subunit M/S [Ancylomarina salipaludis]|uniref:site-specific DNA-methyltransferase (adenine-specific) n=1 Tax=Ancylomarina salipaludis TaxID=2501299 RepID=A0A4Q1JRK0_9BACT|nr:N-6 DNA methylase [Ancylomarina salipaludis]RXQ97415.1 restriction endonuclease subunit M/S [Ancylomarina salipaludis]
MLDSTTKRRIDSARDILVGKVPDPKSQVEQITIALIYKFMDDMDNESEELGGERTFFKGDFEKYAWHKIFDPQNGGFDMISLYAEAIDKMDINPNVPQLFRDIFKNAYLPYRDPETLRSFLKEINKFEYEHSERLGDAFEYLLSVMSSQGDAGQFRTPRHIIDFMVDVIDPQKNESIMDPACGTAGFLISSYKHILKNNSSNFNPETEEKLYANQHASATETVVNGKQYRGDKLTPDDKVRLARNIIGYDISPDMVRLSLVNMYLHGITEPYISEYDTLTSEDKWNEYVDVILANPPFMSPKGGIKPHSKFSIQSKRSEVLFVDYMADHLTPNGRTMVIVPEGVIFQAGTAYKSLRKKLVEENYLIGVISLPSGIFNPYSGVKTSILWFDRSLAKKTDKILFLKVENDGFDLGAQRRPIKLNDLPGIAQIIKSYKQALIEDKEFILEEKEGLLVEKAKIAEDGEYNLNGGRYRSKAKIQSSFKIVEIGEICSLISGGTPSKKESKFWENGDFPWISSKFIDDKGNITGFDLITRCAIDESSTKVAPKGSTVVITRVSVGKTAFAQFDCAINQDLTALVVKDKNVIHEEYLYLVSSKIASIVEANAEGIGVKGVTRKFLEKIQIPLPPLNIQEEIIEEIQSYQKIIDGARQIVDNYKPTINIDPEWEMVKLGDICKPEYGYTDTAKDSGDARFIRITDISSTGELIEVNPKFISLSADSEKYVLYKNDVLVARTGATFGKSMIFQECGTPSVFASFLIRLRFEKLINPKYYWVFAQSQYYWDQANRLVTGGGQPQFNGNAIKQIIIPVPPAEIQEKIISQVVEELALVNQNKRLIEIFEQKITDKINSVWGN